MEDGFLVVRYVTSFFLWILCENKKKFISKIWTLFPANRVLFSEKKPLLAGKDPQKK